MDGKSHGMEISTQQIKQTKKQLFRRLLDIRFYIEMHMLERLNTRKF